MKPIAWLFVSLVSVLVWLGIMLSVLGGPAESPAGLPITPTACPVATEEYFLVDPVTSPTTSFTQTVYVYLGNGEAATITAESGVFAYHGDFGFSNPAEVEMALLPNTTHHLLVTGKVKLVESNGCWYGGYTMNRTADINGDPLVIKQQFPVVTTLYLPVARNK